MCGCVGSFKCSFHAPKVERKTGMSIMDEICEADTPTGYHSPDMVTVDNGADKTSIDHVWLP